MYRVLILLLILLLSGCTSCTNEETQKKMKQEIQTQGVEKKMTATEIFSSVSPKSQAAPKKSQTKQDTDKEEDAGKEENTGKDDDTLDDMKKIEAEAITVIYPKIAEETQKIPDCLERAENKEEAFECGKKLRKLNSELSAAIGDFMEFDMAGYSDDFVWNEETKTNMIKQIEAGMEEVEDTQRCLKEAKDPAELKKCLELQL